MIRRYSLLLSYVNLLASLLFPQLVSASGLQVTPVTLTFSPQQNSAGIWLSNNGQETIQAQVRTFLWSQNNFKDELAPTKDIIISPPMIKLAPNEQQLVRVIRNNLASGKTERSYRLSINEIPISSVKNNKLQFVLHYSLPIFVQPINMPPATVLLEWQLSSSTNNLISLQNKGNTHAQISAVNIVDCKGKRTNINQGLLGYALANSSMQWKIGSIEICSGKNNKLEATINGEQKIYAL
ncbi:fimbrial biogenesis chaperone [Providencia manganoxydans]|uniref:fimbrial biogenesis chaperone n=1 Tax=Providencia manganoxydans TaxID=2923283 RepID=UPI0032DA782C